MLGIQVLGPCEGLGSPRAAPSHFQGAEGVPQAWAHIPQSLKRGGAADLTLVPLGSNLPSLLVL